MEPPGRSDNSDRKATNLLIDKLMQMKPKPKPRSPQRTSKRRRNLKIDDHPKITTWLNKENQVKPLNVTVCKRKPSTSGTAVPKRAKSSKSLKRNSSFEEKYGVAVPSYEKIISDHKKFDEHRENVRLLDVFDDDILKMSLANECLKTPEKFEGELLDCMHLSLEDLDDAFRRHRQRLSDIINGKKYSERHNIYHNNSTNKDLRCSPSLVVFAQKQIEHLLRLLSLEFDPGDKLLTYFFKVLLPELCLLVFMDEHKMSKKEAVAYLDKRPLDV